MTFYTKNLVVCLCLIFAGCVNLLVLALIIIKGSSSLPRFGFTLIVTATICFAFSQFFYSRFKSLRQIAIDDFMALAATLKVSPEALEALEIKKYPGVYQMGGIHYCIGERPIPCHLIWRRHLGNSRVWVGTPSISEMDRNNL